MLMCACFIDTETALHIFSQLGTDMHLASTGVRDKNNNTYLHKSSRSNQTPRCWHVIQGQLTSEYPTGSMSIESRW